MKRYYENENFMNEESLKKNIFVRLDLIRFIYELITNAEDDNYNIICVHNKNLIYMNEEQLRLELALDSSLIRYANLSEELFTLTFYKNKNNSFQFTRNYLFLKLKDKGFIIYLGDDENE